MNTFKVFVLAAVAVVVASLILTGIVTIGTPEKVEALAGNATSSLFAPNAPTPVPAVAPIQVLVANPSTRPVPVIQQGTANVVGNVGVNNTTANPVPVSVQGMTNVAGAVSVNNTQANALWVRSTSNADSIPAQPYQKTITATFSGPAPECYFAAAAFIVPANKRLVTERVSAHINATGPQGTDYASIDALQFTTMVNGEEAIHFLTPIESGTAFSGGIHLATRFVADEAIRVYADPLTEVRGAATIASSYNGRCPSTAHFTFSGFLVDVP